MKSELKRALLKKSNLVLLLAVVSLMMINAYYGGWKTALTAGSASDIRNVEDAVFFEKYYGNMYRVWIDSYYMVQALAPIILAAPCLTTYFTEKKNCFRYFCVSRKGNLNYVLQKVFATALSGALLLAFAELIFAVLTGFMTEQDTSLEFMQGIVSFREDFFLARPLLYFAFLYASHIVYYFCFLIFAFGTTSFLKNRIAVTVVPFLIAGVLDTILPTALQPNVVMQPWRRGFQIGGYGYLMGIYVVTGFFLLLLSEKIYQRRGH